MNKHNGLSHTEVQRLLSQKASLWEDELEKVEKHLETCAECRAYAAFIQELETDAWNPYLAQSPSKMEVAHITSRVQAASQKKAPQNRVHLQQVGGALALVSLLLIIGTMWTRFQSARLTPLANTNNAVPEVSTQWTLTDDWEKRLVQVFNPQQSVPYDGWELGVAFDIPNTWSYQETFVMEGFELGNGMVLANQETTPQEALSPWTLKPGETRVLVITKNPKFDSSYLPYQQKADFTKYFTGITPGEEIIFGNREVRLYQGNSDPYTTTFNRQLIDATFFVEGRLMRIYAESEASESGEFSDLNSMVESIIQSTSAVDYNGWERWDHPFQNVSIAYPSKMRLDYDPSGAVSIMQTESRGELTYRWSMSDIPFDEAFDEASLEEAIRAILPPDSIQEREINLIQNLQPVRFQSNSKTAVVQLEGNPDRVYLIGIKPNDTTRPTFPTQVLTLEIDINNLEEAHLEFENILRGLRGQIVPLFPTEALALDPYFENQGGFSQTEITSSGLYDYGSRMVIDPAKMEIEVQSIKNIGDRIEIEFDMHTSLELMSTSFGTDMYFAFEPTRGSLSDQTGTQYPYFSGIYYSGLRADNGLYHPPNKVIFDQLADLIQHNQFYFSTDIIFFDVRANRDLPINLAGRDWGDQWTHEEVLYLNGIELRTDEWMLDREKALLHISATLDQSLLPYEVLALNTSKHSELEIEVHEDVAILQMPLESIPEEVIEAYLEVNITYETPLNVTFKVDDEGKIDQEK